MDLFRESKTLKTLRLLPGEASTSRALEKRTLLCVWWDSKEIVHYEVLKVVGTINGGDHYQQQLINLNDTLDRKRLE